MIALLLLSVCAAYFVSHKTCPKYNDWWIIGSSYEEIVEKYGEFDYNNGSTKGYYLGKDKSPIMNSGQDMYYWIDFDENGIATKVEVNISPGG